MNELAILTPSFRPDLESFKRLHESVARFADETIYHHVVVPRRDVKVFREIQSSRLRVWSANDFLPEGFITTDGLSALSRKVKGIPQSLNCSAFYARRPWPPIRGWILQQIVKLAATAQLDASAVVMMDSDAVLAQRFHGEMFLKRDIVRFYELPGAVHSGLASHRRWTRVAHELLGLSFDEDIDYPDYVGGLVSWDPRLVRSCLQRVEMVTGRHWAAAITGQLHFSEYILYGTYVRHFASAEQKSATSPESLCHSYWAPTALDEVSAAKFISAYDASDVAVHIQSNSGTSKEIIDVIVRSITEGSSQ